MVERVLLLGAGRMGRVVAAELSSHYLVTVADIKMPPTDLWEEEVTIVKADLEDYDRLRELIRDHDMVVSALPADLAYRAAFACIEEKKDLVDMSYMSEDPTQLHRMAEEAKCTVIVDIGLAPGLTNLITGRVHEEQGSISSARLMVGGMSADRRAPYGYRLTWSPSDLKAEYQRRARYLDNGRVVNKPALSGVEEVIIKGVGVLEAFMTDGLRTLLNMKDVKHMCEKTLRWPGHVKAVKPLLENETFIETMKDNCSTGEDLVVLHCDIDGRIFTMIEHPADGLTAMQRTTALTCATTAKLLGECGSLPKGILLPEDIGRDEGLYLFYMDCLREHNIEIKEEKR